MKRRMITTILCAATITLTGTALTTSAAEMNMPSFEGEQAGVPNSMDGQSFNTEGQAPPVMPDGQSQSFNIDGQTPPAMPEGQNFNAENQAPTAMPDGQNYNTEGQASPAMPEGQSFNTEGQAPPAMPEGQSFNGEGQAPPAMPEGQSFNGEGQAPPAMPEGQMPPVIPDSQGTTENGSPVIVSGSNSGQIQPNMEGQSAPSGAPMTMPGGQNSSMGQPMQPSTDDSHVVAKVTGIDGTTLTVETLKFGEDGVQSTETKTYDIGSLTLSEDIKTDTMVEIGLDADGNVSAVSSDKGMQGGQMGQPMQPMNDDSRVVARVTGIDGDILTVETMKIGDDGTRSTESVAYDVSSLTLGEDIKTDSMVEINLDSDGNVSSVNAGRNMTAGGVPQNGQMPQGGMMPPQGNPNGIAPQQVQFTEVTDDSAAETATDSTDTTTDTE